MFDKSIEEILLEKQAAGEDLSIYKKVYEEGAKLAMAITIGDPDSAGWVESFEGTPMYAAAIQLAQESNGFLAEAQQVADQFNVRISQLEQALLDFKAQALQPVAPPPPPQGTGTMGAPAAPSPQQGPPASAPPGPPAGPTQG